MAPPPSSALGAAQEPAALESLAEPPPPHLLPPPPQPQPPPPLPQQEDAVEASADPGEDFPRRANALAYLDRVRVWRRSRACAARSLHPATACASVPTLFRRRLPHTQVKTQFADRKEVYDQFRELMKQFSEDECV